MSANRRDTRYQLLGNAAASAHPGGPDKGFLERRLASAVAESVSNHFGADRVVRDRKLIGSQLPDWAPQPGTIDVAVVTSQFEPRIVFELKIDHADQTLWDIYKMVSASMLPTVDAAYVAIAASAKVWASRGDCVELFAVPDQIRIRRIGAWPLPAYPTYQLRTVRVEAVERAGWLEFDGDWPRKPDAPPQPGRSPALIDTTHLRREDLPEPGSSEQAYHAFALSFDGYREFGSMRRCGRIANTAIGRWRETGELPTTIRDLRGCLFFEQRRWHHYGYGFDAETMSYVNALVTEIRRHLG